VAAALTVLVLIGLLGYLIQRGERRVALAFAIAPLTVPAMATLWTLDIRTMYVAVVTYPFSLLPGIPAYLLFRRLGWLQIWSVVLASAVLGCAIELLIFGRPNYPGGSAGVLKFCCFGAATGLVFWLIAFLGLRSNNRWRGP
jgi:hypothetical protein